MNEIIFEHINEEFAYGKYGDFKVIIMKKNRYINATKLCGEHNKQYYHWSESEQNKLLLIEVENEIISSPHFQGDEKKATFIIKGGKNTHTRGTYVHELLIPHIASWISPSFAIKVSKIVNSFIIKEYQDSIKEYKNNIKQKDDKIDSLEKMIKNMEKNMERHNKIANDKLDAVLNDNAITHDKLNKTKEQLEESDNKLEHITKKLDVSVERRVPKAQSSRVIEDFVVMAENKNKKCRQYYFIRGQKSHIVKKINTYIEENKNAIEFLRIEDIPHAINLGIRIKEYLGKQLTFKYNSVYLKKQVDLDDEDDDINELSPSEFKDEIMKIYEERKQIDIIL